MASIISLFQLLLDKEKEKEQKGNGQQYSCRNQVVFEEDVTNCKDGDDNNSHDYAVFTFESKTIEVKGKSQPFVIQE
jgi:hypothetical protein